MEIEETQSVTQVRQHETWTAVFMKVVRMPTFSRFQQRLLFGSGTPACPLPSEAARASLGRDDVKEYPFVVVPQVGQIVGEIGEIVADAGLHVLAEAMINRSQHAAAGLMEIQ